MSLNFLRVLYIDFGEINLVWRVRVNETDEFNSTTFPIAQNRVQAVDVRRVVACGSRAGAIVMKFSDHTPCADAEDTAHFGETQSRFDVFEYVRRDYVDFISSICTRNFWDAIFYRCRIKLRE